MCDAWERTKTFLNKHVTIQFVNNVPDAHGYVHAIDPETANIILISLTNPSIVSIIFCPSIKHVKLQVTDADISMNDTMPHHNQPECALLVPPSSATSSADSPFENCDHLLKFLRDHRIDATPVDDGDGDTEAGRSVSVFEGLAKIIPPYGPNCIQSTNEVVLSRIRKLMRTATNQQVDKV